MDQMNFHKLKLYSLIIGAVALISLLLPWIKWGPYSSNGFRSWGYLSLIGVIGVGALCLIGDRTADFSAEYRKYIMIAFGTISLGALLFFFRLSSIAGFSVNSGIGLWLCFLSGLAGLAIIYGLIKVPDRRA
jgi:hypothetical protein